MNDPHVQALLYRVEHSPTFNYEKARPLECDMAEFHIRIENDQATAKPKQHFATAKEAQKVVEPFLRAWELDAALTHDSPDVLRFVYLRSEIIDRNPPPGAVQPGTGGLSVRGEDVTFRTHLEEYSSPPSGLAVEPGCEVAAMFDKWTRYKAGEAELADTANFCLTALEGKEKRKGRRAKAAEKFRISKRVLDRLGQLAERERKYKGYGVPYTGTERTWLEVGLKKLIRRAAEVAYDPNAVRAWVTMDDLPPL
jgi:hypothetical protein